ncbi:MAG: mechanosensitive ion channel family protein [Candidatus Pacebacteria bacterium]|nr:mechanosensitive ion channel family protein [Candidatus Paceibacterota bacterium]
MFNQLSQADWNVTFLGNSVLDYLIALGLFAAFCVVFRIFQKIILKRLEKLAGKTETEIDDILIEAVRSLTPPFYYFVSLYLVLPFLVISAGVLGFIKGVLVILIMYQIIKSLQIVIDYIFEKLAGKKEDAGTKLAFAYLGKFVKIAVWVLGILLVLSNLGVNVNSLLAGLGIGGVAFAFAFKNILGDLFSSFVIFFDKPFLPGDFIMMGDIKGTVQKIGIKTTRLRARTGEEIIVANQALTSAKLFNYKNIEERKATFSFGVTYETATEKLKEIPQMVAEIISGMEKTRFERAHFNRFDDSALNFDVLYFMTVRDYAKYLDTQQAINLKILEKFEKEGIEMAYPTRTVYSK